MSSTITLGLLIKTAVAGAGYGVFAELGSNIDRLKAKTEQARTTQAKLGETIEALKRKGEGVDAASRAYARLGQAISDAERRAESLTHAMTQQQAHAERLRSLWGDALGVAGAAMTLAAPVRQAIAFESAMADVRKVVDGTDEDIAALGATIQRLSREIPLASTELAAMAASAGQLGVKLGDIPEFVTTTAKMAVAFDMPAEEAGDAMAKLANVFGIPIAEIGKLGDAINQISNESPAKASEIVRALSRVGGVSKAFGLAATDAAALASAFVALGKPPEVAGTAINAMLTKLATAPKQGEKFQEALAGMGLSAQQLKAHIDRDAKGALDDFLSRLGKVPKEQRMAVLVDLFGLEYADDIASLAGSLDVYRAQQAAASRAEGSMSREFAARAATTANNLQLLRNNLSELGVNIGSALLPTLNSIVTSLRPAIEAFADFARANPGLIEGIGKVAAVLLALKAGSLVARAGIHLVAGSAWGLIGRMRALGAAVSSVRLMLATRAAMPLISGLASAVPTLGAVRTALMTAGRAVLWLGRAVLMTPIGLTLTAIAGAAYLVWRNWEAIGPKLAAVWQSVKTGFASAWAWFKGLPEQMLALGGEIVGGLIKGIKDKLAAAGDAIAELGETIKTKFKGWLGIRSPSRVFAEFGQMIGLGAAHGIAGMSGAVARASAGLALAASTAFGPQLAVAAPVISPAVHALHATTMTPPQPAEALRTIRQTVEPIALPQPAVHALHATKPASTVHAAAGMQITFAPVIHVNTSDKAAVVEQVRDGLRLSFAEFERLMRRYEAERRRLSPMGGLL